MIARADISGSVYGLSKPWLQMKSTSFPARPNEILGKAGGPLATGFQALHAQIGFDNDFLDVLCEVHTVTRDMNIANPPKSETIPLELRKRARSIQYSLLHGERYKIDATGNRIREICSLGVLLYVGIIQKEFIVSPISKRFIQQIQSCHQYGTFSTDSTRALHLWVMFLVSSLLQTSPERSWFLHIIKESISHHSLRSWSDTKLLLESFAWSGKIQDRSGEELWEATSTI
jgi:hypothetical protein